MIQATAFGEDGLMRCGWCLGDPIYQAYHDEEWGVPVHDDRRWFEMLTLEGAQAGLSWLTILKRRDAYRRAYADWDVEGVARFSEADRRRLLSEDSGIVRNKLKVAASISNAARFIEVAEEFGSFDAYMWRFTEGRTLRPTPRAVEWRDLPTQSDLSRAMSRDLKRRGFGFVGPTICYAHMQACGMVDDHLAGCYRIEEA